MAKAVNARLPKYAQNVANKGDGGAAPVAVVLEAVYETVGTEVEVADVDIVVFDATLPVEDDEFAEDAGGLDLVFDAVSRPERLTVRAVDPVPTIITPEEAALTSWPSMEVAVPPGVRVALPTAMLDPTWEAVNVVSWRETTTPVKTGAPVVRPMVWALGPVPMIRPVEIALTVCPATNVAGPPAESVAVPTTTAEPVLLTIVTAELPMVTTPVCATAAGGCGAVVLIEIVAAVLPVPMTMPSEAALTT